MNILVTAIVGVLGSILVAGFAGWMGARLHKRVDDADIALKKAMTTDVTVATFVKSNNDLREQVEHQTKEIAGMVLLVAEHVAKEVVLDKTIETLTAEIVSMRVEGIKSTALHAAALAELTESNHAGATKITSLELKITDLEGKVSAFELKSSSDNEKIQGLLLKLGTSAIPGAPTVESVAAAAAGNPDNVGSEVEKAKLAAPTSPNQPTP